MQQCQRTVRRSVLPTVYSRFTIFRSSTLPLTSLLPHQLKSEYNAEFHLANNSLQSMSFSTTRLSLTTFQSNSKSAPEAPSGDQEKRPPLGLSPYGGRFGVREQPRNSKSIASMDVSTNKRSPFAKAKTGMQRKVNDWTDKEKNLEKRKELLTDFQSGYFHEFSEINRTGSKLWRGADNMLPADQALYMPNIIGTSLATSELVELVDVLKGKISVVTFSGTRFGEEHNQTFTTPFLEKWPMTASTSTSPANSSTSHQPKVQLVELNIQENPLKAGLVRMMVPFVKKSIPVERHNNYILYYKPIKHLKDPLSMQNSYLGYTFLVDGNCKIRWGAHGNATEKELKTLLTSVQKLVDTKGR